MSFLFHKEKIEFYLKKTDRYCSAFSFVSLFAWDDYFDYDCQVHDDQLCIFAENNVGTFLVLPPLGKTLNREVIDFCFKQMQYKNKNGGISRIENITESLLPFYRANKYCLYEKSKEYIYRREDIAELKGARFKNRRHQLNQFQSHFRGRFVPYESSMLDDCGRLYSRWSKQRLTKNQDSVYAQMIKDNESVHQKLLRFHRELGLIGRVVEIDESLCGYSFGYALNETTFCIVLEIADLEVKGLPAYIFNQFCRDDEVKNYLWINAMDDFEMEQLQRTKLSYRPTSTPGMYVASQN